MSTRTAMLEFIDDIDKWIETVKSSEAATIDKQIQKQHALSLLERMKLDAIDKVDIEQGQIKNAYNQGAIDSFKCPCPLSVFLAKDYANHYYASTYSETVKS